TCARWRQAPLPGADLECRACAVDRHRIAGQGGRGGAEPDVRVILLWLGRAYGRLDRDTLQSDELSQWIRVAPRQRHPGGRVCPLRLPWRGGADLRRPVRRLGLYRPAPPAGTVLRIPAPAGARADVLSG